jgi:hypothetical protein
MDNPDRLAVHIRSVSCVASISGLSIVLFVFVLCLVLPVYLDCPLFCWSSSCVLCCQFIWIVHCFVCLRPVSCVGNLSGLSIVLFNWKHKTHDEDKQNNGKTYNKSRHLYFLNNNFLLS